MRRFLTRLLVRLKRSESEADEEAHYIPSPWSAKAPGATPSNPKKAGITPTAGNQHAAWLTKALDAQLEQLVDAALIQERGATKAFRMLKRRLPRAHRKACAALYAEKMQQAYDDYGIEGAFTKEQCRQLRAMMQQEPPAIRNTISARSLRQIRAMLLRQPEALSMVQTIHERAAALGKSHEMPAPSATQQQADRSRGT